MGFGLAAVLGLTLPMSPPPSLLSLIIQAVLCFGLIGVGVAASTLHLGQPQRAWRAFSQWHTSWLSREAVLAVFTTGLLAVYFAIHFATHFTGYFGDWVSGLFAVFSPWQAWLGWVSAGFALITVFATAMIYASLKPIALWHHALTPVMFLAWALAGGILTATSIEAILVGGDSTMLMAAVLALLVAGVVKLFWWRWRRRCVTISSPESATGLGNLGGGQNQVRLLIPPHSEENWLQHEMGFIVARRHARRLAGIAFLFAILIPVVALLFYLTAETTPQPLILIPTTLIHIIGVMIDRWLFFAEAKHSVTLYYGERH
ncbi:MAG: dimethyl sulfoxide reductase anchor subunit [Proteobacteria bacterium]|nr:dimethyl sulfoxide reductase anchor subunit [Pseudomonadota bacterium]